MELMADRTHTRDDNLGLGQGIVDNQIYTHTVRSATCLPRKGTGCLTRRRRPQLFSRFIGRRRPSSWSRQLRRCGPPCPRTGLSSAPMRSMR